MDSEFKWIPTREMLRDFEAIAWQQEWLTNYIQNYGGFFFDRILNRWCGRVPAGVTTTRRFT